MNTRIDRIEHMPIHRGVAQPDLMRPRSSEEPVVEPLHHARPERQVPLVLR